MTPKASRRRAADALDPEPGERFTFGLWTVGNPGRDPFGGPVRPVQDPCALVAGLARVGAWGVNLHDDDLVPFGSTAAARDRIVRDFRSALADHGLRVPMATTNLFGHPVFKDGAFTANDPRVRAFALRKTMAAIDLGVELGARIHVFWGGREGAEADAVRDPRTALLRLRDALDLLCGYVADQRYPTRFALEAKPNEPRGDIYLPTTGHMLHFISTLADGSRVGVNPEVAHETMSGLSFAHALAQAMETGKLFHVDLNAQKIGRYDQDLRFGSEDLKGAFLAVRMLEGTAARHLPADALRGGAQRRYDGPLHFDAHAYRTEDLDGVWDFARGCMRTYKILASRAAAFDGDPEVRALLSATQGTTGAEARRLAPLLRGFSRAKVRKLRGLPLDPEALGARGLHHERLDQLLTEHLLGARG